MSDVKMDRQKAVAVIEGFSPPPEFVDCGLSIGQLTLAAWQFLIDSGEAWKLPGFFSSGADALISSGQCKPPKVQA